MNVANINNSAMNAWQTKLGEVITYMPAALASAYSPSADPPPLDLFCNGVLHPVQQLTIK
jgi:hypothetical protein